eukprot:CAMPEP_0114576446 /NCGR_PEP_ID=MMETSP0125-20121206/1207_1 /TAXON_ID=485358 ORGANISM="Aristerostoma sp., Strain ATCC 50986" /NCGR_SAMPLE_ID=MMETSP0125 /ASSEMBLY_ACC=CAM_ASM_000245 /LENGTH=369 /DNA_ID=CAMNT_0001764967 /DNA_START=101 /DNA_END=1211 /DNA_ORIENTATION=-
MDEDIRYRQVADEIRQWWATPRFKRIQRPYTAEDVAKLRGNLQLQTPSHFFSKKLWGMLVEAKEKKTFHHTFGALDPVQVVNLAKYLTTVYVSGWQCSSTASVTNEPGPDFADYPANTVPNKVDQLVRALLFHDRKQNQARSKMDQQTRSKTPKYIFQRHIRNNKMGGKKSVPQKDPREEIEDAIFNMKFTAKQFENAAKKAQKEQKKEIQKAKDALKKNNEEGAKLFLQNAATKYKESSNMLRMAHRMDAISAHLKSNITNSDLMKTLSGITPQLQMQQQFMDHESLSNNMNNYQKAMDDLMIQGKIMDSAMNENMADEASDTGVENMLSNLKQEVALEINNGLSQDPNLQFNKLSGDPNLNVMGDQK